MPSKPILITGGEGFLGKHLQRHLNKLGVAYKTLDRTNAADIKLNILDLEKGRIIGKYDRVIHLAGVLGTHELFEDIDRAVDVNVKGTVRVLNFCREQGIPYTGITMAHVWNNPYETTKAAAERLAAAWSREYGFPANYVTVYNAYGEHQAHGGGHPQKIIPTFARAAITNRPIPIWGDGEQKVDLVYAGDVAKLLYERSATPWLVEGLEGGYGVARTVNEVARMVWWEARHEAPWVEHLPMRRGEHTPARDPVANKPIEPALPVEETLFSTINWYRNSQCGEKR